MYGKMKEHLSKTLTEIKEAGLYKDERLIESPQGAAIQVKGKEVLNFCANNYLGLSNHPRLIEGAKKMMERRGFGMSSVRFICGSQDIHKELKLPSLITLRQKTLFSMLHASMPMEACSNLYSLTRTQSSPILLITRQLSTVSGSARRNVIAMQTLIWPTWSVA